MVVKRGLGVYWEAQLLLSFLFAAPLAIGLGVYFSSDSNTSALQAGFVLSLVFGSLLGVVQLVFAGIYLWGAREIIVVDGGSVAVHSWGKTVSFQTRDIVRWDYQRAYSTSAISFLLYDGRHVVADAIRKMSVDDLAAFSAVLFCPEGVNRRVVKVVEDLPEWALKKELGRWPFFLTGLGIFLSLFTAWAFVGFIMGTSNDPSSGNLPPFNPGLGTLAGISTALWLGDWSGLLFLVTRRKNRAVFTKEEVAFHWKGKVIHLPYHEILAIKESPRGLENYPVFSLPCLLIQSKNETYVIRFVRISQESEDQILRLSGFFCNDHSIGKGELWTKK
jgi:hypothetical protein